MANEWPENNSLVWDTAIDNNLNAGHQSNGTHALGVLSAFKTVLLLNGVDLTTISDGDTTAIATVGFQPRQVMFFASVASTSVGSWGVDDGTTSWNIRQVSDGVTTRSSGESIALDTVAGATIIEGTITTLASTGFTVTWSVTGSPSGTATVIALCLK